MSARVVVLANGQAGALANGEARDELRGAICAALPDAEVRFCGEQDDVLTLARDAVNAGAEIVVAAGGDGTVNAVASAVAGTRAAMGLLPLGTLNHFAKDLGIPTERGEAIDVLAQGGTARVDVAEVNGRIFVNNSGVGLYPTIVRLREQRQQHGWRKWPAFAVATITALARYRKLHVRVSANGQALARTTPIVFVGNNRYATVGPKLGTRERLDRGELSLVIPHPHRPLRLLWYAVLALLGRRFERDDVDVIHAPALRIESRHEHLRVSIDGEVATLPAPLEYRVRPRALRVLVPLREQAA